MTHDQSVWLATLTLLLCWPFIGAAHAQDREFIHPDGRYAITLKEGWEEVISKDGAGNTVVDIIFENRERGVLRIRERRRDQDIAPQELAQRDQETSIRFRPGFVQGSIEPFNHKEYPGALLTFDFAYGGRPKTAFYYYLKIDANSYYMLQFEGHPQVLKTMRNRTDLMARSFRVLR
ncbi:MAG: hypothetical protein RMM98_17440 [Acidobacteriota bacterium]|nr:hypothetical protein [Blastocatellia bacterium]MDW8241388.1 hypothetical protein [Acidobacteriota bacterium]